MPPLPVFTDLERQQVHDVSDGYKRFLKTAVCGPLTAKAIIERAQAKGFKPLPEKGRVKPGEKYYIANGLESVALVTIGKRDPKISGFNIVGAHIDSPQLELKPDPDYASRGMMKLKTKVRGGILMDSWKDKPLGIAGRIFTPLRDAEGRPQLDPDTLIPLMKEAFVQFDSPALVIPRVPPHLLKGQNDGVKTNPENDLAVLAAIEQADFTQQIRAVFASKGIDIDDLSGAELYLYPAVPPTDALLDSADGSAIIAQGHDDRAMTYTAMEGLFEAAESTGSDGPEKTGIAFFFNNEENGSLNRGGARAQFPLSVAGKVLRLQTGRWAHNIPERETALEKSFIFSADVAHSWEPSQKRYHDEQNAVQMGYGPAIKADTDGHYATTAEGIAKSRVIGQAAGVPMQVYSTNQDIPCGTTIGPFIASGTSALTVDIGIPILGMHSALEVAAKRDVYYAQKLFASFYRNDPPKAN